MESIILLVILLAIFSFGGQLIKGATNIFSIVGRIAGWVIGIVLVLFFIKILLFG